MILIQCIGNRYGGDDGFGPAVFDQLQQMELPENVRVTEHWGEGTELMQHWDGVEKVFLIDAAHTGAKPGTIHQFDALKDKIPKNLCIHATHRFGVLEAIELARSLGHLPEQLHLIAVEGADFSPGGILTPTVGNAAYRIVDLFINMPTTEFLEKSSW